MKIKRKHFTLAEKVFYRMHMVRYWRNYDFYFCNSSCNRRGFLSDYEKDIFTFSVYGMSLRAFLVIYEKEFKYVQKVFNDDGHVFREDCLVRIKKLKKRGKAKLLCGHLFDDKKDNNKITIYDYNHFVSPHFNSENLCKTNIKSLDNVIKKFVELR